MHCLSCGGESIHLVPHASRQPQLASRLPSPLVPVPRSTTPQPELVELVLSESRQTLNRGAAGARSTLIIDQP